MVATTYLPVQEYRITSEWDWFVATESKLFAIRLGKLPPLAAIELLASEGIQHEFLSEGDITDKGIFRVPFAEAPQLVKHREVVIRDGFCLIPLRKMNNVAIYHFRRCLLKQMRELQSALPAQGPEVERLTPILDKFVQEAKVLTGTANLLRKTTNKPTLKVEAIDLIAEKHFPLCMVQLHRKLRANHHLKYDGRVQYRLFLKGAGISVHDCIQFFRSEFIKSIPATKFDKEYTYHIRHSYGLEGSRIDYAPLDCERIISQSPPRHGQYHGCPFRHWDRSVLQDELRRRGLSLESAMEVTQQASAGNCQHACSIFFEKTHSSTIKNVHAGTQDAFAGLKRTPSLMHPNTYLNASLATII